MPAGNPPFDHHAIAVVHPPTIRGTVAEPLDATDDLVPQDDRGANRKVRRVIGPTGEDGIVRAADSAGLDAEQRRVVAGLGERETLDLDLRGAVETAALAVCELVLICGPEPLSVASPIRLRANSGDCVLITELGNRTIRLLRERFAACCRSLSRRSSRQAAR